MAGQPVIESVEVRIFSTERGTVHAQPVPGQDRGGVDLALLVLRDSDGQEGYAVGQPEVLRPAQLRDHIAPLLVGRPVFGREAILADVYRRQRGQQAHLPERTICRIDVALWDLQARRLGQPVWRLLGGARPRVPAYASTMRGDDVPGGLTDPRAFADFAVALAERGYRAIKLHTWHPAYGEEPDPRRDIAACQAARDAVGPRVELMLDPYHWYSRTDALSLGRALEELGFLWLEEPMAETSMAAYRWLSDNLRIPVVGPETVAGRSQARADWIAAGATAISRIGPLNGGGITPCLKALHTADSFGMNCEIHGSGAASLALVAATNVSRWYERGMLHPLVDYETPPPHLRAIVDPLDPDGTVPLSEEPGVGEHLDLDYIEAHRKAAY
ncbi:enolase C-terminal domain-like protein [Jiangella endophytica]|uniref:enolase C-terminal domain-like protein n=1 Tax=Jiangella endophytica TaxID=1623398 RepID=UPI000E34942E|nr:enolase C-terminal domain-like protein [Jiangella endophytica]